MSLNISPLKIPVAIVLKKSTPSVGNTSLLRTLSQAVNIEKGIGETAELSSEQKQEILAKDQALRNSDKSYCQLKEYIIEKIELLKKQPLQSMTICCPNNTKGVIFRGQIAPGFSDNLFYTPQSLKEFHFNFSNIIPQGQLYILTPIDNPIIDSQNFYDTSRMYKVPANLFGFS